MSVVSYRLVHADVVKWHTRSLEVAVPQGVEVRLLSSAH